MRVLVQIRPNHAERPGGDTVHAECTAAALSELGVDVRVDGAWAPDLAPYDLVHIFNTQLIEPTLHHSLRARGSRIPIVLSPIYWDTSPVRAPGTSVQQEALQGLALRLAHRVLPNSNIEAELLASKFPHVRDRLQVVYNGAAEGWAKGDAARFCNRYALTERAFVLCAARKERLKNQLRLIAACGDLGLPLVLAGAEVPESGYADECRQLAASSGAQVLFLPHLEQVELADAYAAARVHALPSLLDSVGLSSLEAAVGGCNIVSTAVGGAREYLGDAAWYCDPGSIESIRDAVAAAYAAPLTQHLGRKVAEEFTWSRAAADTLVAYRAVIDEQRRSQPSPPLPLEEYVQHLEELLHIQLETIAGRDQQYAKLQGDVQRLEGYVRHLESQLAEGRSAIDQGKEYARHLEEHVRYVELQLAAAQTEVVRVSAEIDRIQATKLFRYTAPLRRAYARLRSARR